MEKRSYQDLARIYQEMYQVDEARRNAGSGGGGKSARYVQDKADTPIGHVQNRPKKGGELVDKSKASSSYKDQAKADRKAAAMERRKEGTAKPTKLDNLLKDIKK